jgi:hypothetical protein
MNLQQTFRLAALLAVSVVGLSCQSPNYRYEVTGGTEGRTEIQRVPLTPEEQAQKEREKQVRAALAAPPPPPPEPDLATLESLWPKLSPTDKAAVLDLAKRSAGEQK